MKSFYLIFFLFILNCATVPTSMGYILDTSKFETDVEFYDIKYNAHVNSNIFIDRNKTRGIRYDFSTNQLYVLKKISPTIVKIIVVDLEESNVVDTMTFETINDSEVFDYDSGEVYYTVLVFNEYQNKYYTEVWKTKSDKKTNVKLFHTQAGIYSLSSFKNKILFSTRNRRFNLYRSFIFNEEENEINEISSGLCSINKMLGKAVSVSFRGLEIFDFLDSTIDFYDIKESYNLEVSHIKDLYLIGSNFVIFKYYKRTITELNFLSWVQNKKEYDVYSLDLNNGVLINHGYAPGGNIYDVFY